MTENNRLALATTGIGSLPHHNIDAALAFSFGLKIPFLPQIPIRNPWEYMIAGTLEGLPGLHVEQDTTASLDTGVWHGRMRAFNERLLNAFASSAKADAFESFEPSSAASSCWQPFLWELEERGMKIAKLQLAGPMTAQWALRLDDGTSIEREPDLAAQIFRLVLARAFAMSRRLQAGGIQPVIYLDEPGLYGLTPQNPRHAMGIQELKLMVGALRKEGVITGLHCCSNTDWSVVLGLGLDILSLDTALSLASLLETPKELARFLEAGGRLSLGIVPTTGPAEAVRAVEPGELYERVAEPLRAALSPALAQKVLRESIYTPACGLALHSPWDADTIGEMLRALAQHAENA